MMKTDFVPPDAMLQTGQVGMHKCERSFYETEAGMIRQKLISIICIVLWVIVLVPAAAMAEAWVLWSKNELLSYDKGGVSKESREWEIIYAFPGYKQCIQGQEQTWKQRKIVWSNPEDKTVEKVDGKKPDLLIIHYKGSGDKSAGARRTDTLMCLPAPLDPRDRK